MSDMREAEPARPKRDGYRNGGQDHLLIRLGDQQMAQPATKVDLSKRSIRHDRSWMSRLATAHESSLSEGLDPRLCKRVTTCLSARVPSRKTARPKNLTFQSRHQRNRTLGFIEMLETYGHDDIGAMAEVDANFSEDDDNVGHLRTIQELAAAA